MKSIGCDLTRIGDVENSVARFGDRYLDRIYTAREIEDARQSSFYPSLAARFAAKEAVLKSLRVTGPLCWRSIEIIRTPGGWCEVTLHDEAATIAADRDITTFHLSLSHTGEYALAVAAAC